MGCGKLSDDTDRPSSPTGTSGGVPIPIGPQSSVGTYTLSISSDSDTLPADNLNYTHVRAKLSDTSGRSVENFTMYFSSDPIGNLTTDHLFAATVLTDANGEAAVRFYGEVSGDCTVQASVDLDDNGNRDIFVTTVITLTSSGQPSSAGSYKLVVTANPDTIPADSITYSTIVAKLYDSSGGSVENFEITFTSDLGYLENDPEGLETTATTITTLTDKSGSSSVYFYGARKGSAVISASVYVNDLVGTLQAKTIVLITEGTGEPGDGVAGIKIQADPVTQIIQADETGYADVEEVTVTANVWEETGDLAGAGVQVVFTYTSQSGGSGTAYAYTDATGTATTALKFGNKLPVGTYRYTVTACVTIDDKEYCDSTNVIITVTGADVELTAIASPESVETGETSTISVRVSTSGGVAIGQTVLFSTNLGSVSPTSAVTNSSGVATTTFYAGTTAGTATIFITSGTASETLEITITDAPSSITASAPNTTLTLGSSTSVSTTLTATATVRNASNELIEGVAVGFSITPSTSCGTANASFSPASGSGTTNIAGLAEFEFDVTATATGNCTYTLNVNTGSLSDSDTGTITVN